MFYAVSLQQKKQLEMQSLSEVKIKLSLESCATPGPDPGPCRFQFLFKVMGPFPLNQWLTQATLQMLQAGGREQKPSQDLVDSAQCELKALQ